MATIWYNSSHVFIKNSSEKTGQKKSSLGGESYMDQFKSNVHVILPVYVITLAACLIGNILVCVTVMKSKEMRRKNWYYFLVNLAIADMGFALITPMYMLQSAGVNIGDLGCKISLNMINVTLLVSIWTLAYISFHRYLNICHPMVTWVKRISPLWVIVSLWVCAGIFLLPVSLYCSQRVTSGNNCSCRSRSKTHYRIYQFVLAIVGFYFPFPIMLFCYTMITIRLLGNRGDRSGIENDQSGKKKRSIKMMMLATLMFFITIFPFSVLFLMNRTESKIFRKSLLAEKLMAFVNSACNPYIYCMFCKNFRSSFKRMLFCRKSNGVTENPMNRQ